MLKIDDIFKKLKVTDEEEGIELEFQLFKDDGDEDDEYSLFLSLVNSGTGCTYGHIKNTEDVLKAIDTYLSNI